MYQSRSYKASLLIRLGLAFCFAYAATRALMDPSAWIGFVPAWVENFDFDRERFLFAFSIFQLAWALLLISNFKPKFLGLISGFMLLGVTFGTGIASLDVTFRDLGLAFAAFSLFLLN